MSGAYTHIMLENEMREPMRLEAIPGFPEDAIVTILDYFKFCELGALGPDYPFLALDEPAAATWGDLMHYTRAGEMVHAGIRMLREMEGEAQQKGLAWLLGYSAHVTTDAIIHPVVEKKVGPYHENKSSHRICEMNQDAYIFQRLNVGDIGLSEHLESGIGRCEDPDDPDRMDPDVANLWQRMMEDVHPDDFGENPPDVHLWHRRFKLMVGKIASSGNVLLPIARHVASGLGLVYPLSDEVDMQYVEDLETPGGTRHFDDIFDRAVKGAEGVWSLVARGVLEGDDECFERIINCNLDTGRDDNERLVFWKEEGDEEGTFFSDLIDSISGLW